MSQETVKLIIPVFKIPTEWRHRQPKRASCGKRSPTPCTGGALAYSLRGHYIDARGREYCLNNMAVTSWITHRHSNKTAATMKSSSIWDITPCSLVTANHRLHLQFCLLPSWWFLNRLIFRSWNEGDVPPKRRLAFTGLHGIIAQKTEIINRHSRVEIKLFLCLNSGFRNIFSNKLDVLVYWGLFNGFFDSSYWSCLIN
jgi:hypothetical protein